jgi:hypothetical protein
MLKDVITNHYTQEVSVNGMTVRTSKKAPKVGEIFYVSSESQPESEYVVRTRKRYLGLNGKVLQPWSQNYSRIRSDDFICSCPDFFFQEWAARDTCKHIKAVKFLVELAGSSKRLEGTGERLLRIGPTGSPGPTGVTGFNRAVEVSTEVLASKLRNL